MKANSPRKYDAELSIQRDFKQFIDLSSVLIRPYFNTEIRTRTTNVQLSSKGRPSYSAFKICTLACALLLPGADSPRGRANAM